MRQRKQAERERAIIIEVADVPFLFRLLREADGRDATFRRAVADALAVLRVEFERRASHDSGASEPWRAAFSMAESELRATIAALNLETQ